MNRVVLLLVILILLPSCNDDDPVSITPTPRETNTNGKKVTNGESDDGSGSNVVVKEVKPVYVEELPKSYLPGVSEKESADEEDSTDNEYTKEMVTSYFLKKYDLGHLKAMYEKTIQETINYGESQLGIDFFRNNCFYTYVSENSLVSMLATPPTYIQDEWNKSTAEINDGSVLGMYLPEGQYISGVELTNPTIILNPAATRMVVVHEILHHLFQSQSDKLQGRALEKEMQAYSDKFEELVRNLESDVSYKTFNELFSFLREYYELMKDHAINYPLEEAVIERLILQRHRAKKFSYDHGFVPLNAKEYARRGIKNALENMNVFIEWNKALKKEVLYQLYSVSSDQRKKLINYADRNIDMIASFVHDINDFAKGLDRERLGVGVYKYQLKLDEHQHKGCNRHFKTPKLTMPKVDFKSLDLNSN